MVRVPSLNISGTQLQAQQVIPETSDLSIAGQALEGVGNIVVEKEKRDAKAWAIEADSELRFAGLNAMEEARNEAELPDQIGKLYFDKMAKKKEMLAQNAPNQFAQDEFENIFQNVKRSQGQQVIQMELNESQAYRKNQINESINKGLNFVRGGGSYSDTRQLMDGYLQQADEVLSPTEMQEFKQKTVKGLKSSYLDYQFEQGNIKEIQAKINDPKFNSEFTANEIGAYRKAISKQRDEFRQMQSSNPAKAAILEGAETLEEIANYQLDLGIPLEQVSVIPQEEAKDMVSKLQRANDPQEFTNVLTDFNKRYGSYKVNALNDLINQKLPASYLYAANLDPVADAEAIGLLFDSIRGGEKELASLTKKRLIDDSKTMSDFSNDLSSSLAEELQYMIDEGKSPDTINQIYSQTKNIAMARYNRTGDLSGAIDFAKGVLVGDDNYGSYNSAIFKVPANYDVSQVEIGLEYAIDNVDVLIPEEDELTASIIGSNIKESAKWVSNYDKTGLQLVSSLGLPLRNTDKDLIEYSYDELISMAKKSQKDRVRALEKEKERLERGELTDKEIMERRFP